LPHAHAPARQVPSPSTDCFTHVQPLEQSSVVRQACVPSERGPGGVAVTVRIVSRSTPSIVETSPTVVLSTGIRS
jgi:hypothetical protein